MAIGSSRDHRTSPPPNDKGTSLPPTTSPHEIGSDLLLLSGSGPYGSTKPARSEHNQKLARDDSGKSSGMPLNPERPGSLGLDAPEAFRRPINKSVDLPMVLATRDILDSDWERFMTDIGAAWMGRLPLPSGKTPKPASLVMDLIELWNHSCFLQRGVELELYRGRELRTGRNAGRAEFRLPRVEAYSPESSDVSSDESDPEPGVQNTELYEGVYGRYNRDAERERRKREARRGEEAAQKGGKEEV